MTWPSLLAALVVTAALSLTGPGNVALAHVRGLPPPVAGAALSSGEEHGQTLDRHRGEDGTAVADPLAAPPAWMAPGVLAGSGADLRGAGSPASPQLPAWAVQPPTWARAALEAATRAWLPLGAFAGVALGLVAMGRRRAVALTLTAVLSVLAFETGLHSVHHLGQDEQAAACAVASAAPQLNATEVGCGAAFDAPAPAVGARQEPETAGPRARLARFTDGRAPPISLSLPYSR